MTSLWPQACLSGNDADFPSDINDAVENIRKATKGFGTDEKALISALGALGPAQRALVAKRYEEEYEKNLAKLMSKECGGDFGEALQLLAQPIAEAEASIIRKACKGVGTTEKLVYETLCGRTNDEINAIKKAYYKLYGKDLNVVLAGELGGDLEALIMQCLQADEEEFNPDVHTEEKAKEDARLFDMAGRKKKLGTFQLICSSPAEYLKMVNLAYVERVGYSLARSLAKELGGHAKDAAVHTVNMKLKPVDTAVSIIESMMKGIGTDEYGLTVAVLRYQALLGSGFNAYEKEYGKSLEKRVKRELKGDFEKLIVEMIDADVKM